MGAPLETCGWGELPCHTVHQTVSQSAPSESKRPTIILLSVKETSGTIRNHPAGVESVLIDSACLITGDTLEEEGLPTAKKEIESLRAVLFSIASLSTLTIQQITFGSPSDISVASLSHSVIDAHTGFIEMSATKFENITLSNNPLLQVSTQDNAFRMASMKYGAEDDEKHTKCIFEDITRTEGAGGIFSVTLKGGEFLQLTNALFSRCKSTPARDSNAPVWIDVIGASLQNADEKPKRVPASLSQLATLEFTECTVGSSSTEDATHSLPVRSIYTAGIDAADYLKPSTLLAESPVSFYGTITEYLKADEPACSVKETLTSRSRILSASLFHFVFAPSASPDDDLLIHVEDDGVETETCGWSDVPCRFIGTATAHSGEHTNVLVHAGTHPPESSTVSLSTEYSFSGDGLTENADITTIKQVSSSASPLFSLTSSVLLSLNQILFRWIGAEDEVLTHPIHSEIRPTVSSPSLELSLRRFHSITLLSFNHQLEVSPS